MTAARKTRGGAPGASRQAAPAPAPAPLPAPALDAHTHLDALDSPPADVMAAAFAAGITRVVTVGVDLPTSRWAADCAARHDGVCAAVAIHPNETSAAASTPAQRDAVLAELAHLAALPQVRAVGETGLDYHRDYSPPDVQRDWFRAHIEIAKASGKALMIHDRDAHEDVLAILEQEGPPEKVIFHCFSGDAAMVKRCAEHGYVMSFAGNVTFANAGELREAARAAPADLILAETDAPFLTPAPHRGKPNAPALAAHTVRFLADLKHIPLAEFCGILSANGERIFGAW